MSQYGAPNGPPPSHPGSANDYYNSGKNDYAQQQQQPMYQQGPQDRGFGGQQQYYQQQPPQGYYQQQPQYYQQQPQPVYVQQQQPQSNNADCLTACLAGMCVCCALDAIF